MMVSALPLALTVMTRGLRSHRLRRRLVYVEEREGLYSIRIDFINTLLTRSTRMNNSFPKQPIMYRLGIIR